MLLSYPHPLALLMLITDVNPSDDTVADVPGPLPVDVFSVSCPVLPGDFVCLRVSPERHVADDAVIGAIWDESVHLNVDNSTSGPVSNAVGVLLRVLSSRIELYHHGPASKIIRAQAMCRARLRFHEPPHMTADVDMLPDADEALPPVVIRAGLALPATALDALQESTICSRVWRLSVLAVPGVSAYGSGASSAPDDLSWLIARSMAVGDRDRQELLEAPGALSRLGLELSKLRACTGATLRSADAPLPMCGKDGSRIAAAAAAAPAGELAALVCADCHECIAPIASAKTAGTVERGSGESVFSNPAGWAVRLIVVPRARVAVCRHYAPSREASYFEGFAWTAVECAACAAHLGWRFDDCRFLSDDLLGVMQHSEAARDDDGGGTTADAGAGAGAGARAAWPPPPPAPLVVFGALVSARERRRLRDENGFTFRTDPPTPITHEDFLLRAYQSPLSQPFYALISGRVVARLLVGMAI